MNFVKKEMITSVPVLFYQHSVYLVTRSNYIKKNDPNELLDIHSTNRASNAEWICKHGINTSRKRNPSYVKKNQWFYLSRNSSTHKNSSSYTNRRKVLQFKDFIHANQRIRYWKTVWYIWKYKKNVLSMSQ